MTLCVFNDHTHSFRHLYKHSKTLIITRSSRKKFRESFVFKLSIVSVPRLEKVKFLSLKVFSCLYLVLERV